MLARIFPEIARSQDQIREYAGDQVEVRKAVRKLVDPMLSALSLSEGVLTQRASAVAAQVASLHLGATPDTAPEAARVTAAKTGLLRGFLEVIARLAVEATHQAAHLRENISKRGKRPGSQAGAGDRVTRSGR
jgi:hypothetical protein